MSRILYYLVLCLMPHSLVANFVSRPEKDLSSYRQGSGVYHVIFSIGTACERAGAYIAEYPLNAVVHFRSAFLMEEGRSQADIPGLQSDEQKTQRLARELEMETALRESLEIRNRNMLVTFLVVCTILLTGLIVTSYRMQGFRRRSKLSMGEINRFIRDKNRQLQHHDDFKNKLLSILAHDFRMPLGHIINASMLFDKEDIKPQEMRELSGSIASMANETLQLFENVLRWIKSQLAGFEYKPQPYDLKELWTEVQEPLAEHIREKKLQVDVVITEQLTVMADKEMLQFVNRNLLHNAVKFSRKGNRVVVRCTAEGSRVCVTVTNEGVGIKAIDLPFVFEHKVVGKFARETGRGAGIALIICKDFMERMGGVITVRSDGDSYTTFEYML